MPRPILPAWNTDGTNRTEPSSGQKASGWTLGQKPPSGYFNWWMNRVYEVLKWQTEEPRLMASSDFQPIGGQVIGLGTESALKEIAFYGPAGIQWFTPNKPISGRVPIYPGETFSSLSIYLKRRVDLAGPSPEGEFTLSLHALDVTTGVSTQFANKTVNSGSGVQTVTWSTTDFDDVGYLLIPSNIVILMQINATTFPDVTLATSYATVYGGKLIVS